MTDEFRFGRKSQNKIASLHPVWQFILPVALERSPYDITIVHGLRNKEVQNRLHSEGASYKRWPDSRHNKTDDPETSEKDRWLLSDAVDFAPWVNGGIPWEDTHIFACVAGVIMATAVEFEQKTRWGGDWDADGSTRDHTLLDWGHIELVWE